MKKRLTGVVHALVGVVCLSALSGCVTLKSKPSGFLDDYSQMEQSEEAKSLRMDSHKEEYIGQYTKCIIDPIVVYFHPSAKGMKVDPTQLKEMSDLFEEQLTQALAERYEIVTAPGPGVIRIRTALTDVIPNKPYLNLHWSTTLARFGIGGASMEAELVDSQTQNRILAFMDARMGKPLRYSKGLSRWGHTKDVFDQWVELLVSKLDELHKSEPAP